MTVNWMDWVEMLVRWLHVIAGIGWIGSSFYFMFLDASLRKYDDMAAGIAGESWQVHGGGFYHMRKFLVAPPQLPGELHWFKWEAYATWLSGFTLLGLVYYLKAGVYLVDRQVMDLSAPAAVALSIGSLIAGWLIYDGLCKSPLRRAEGWLAAVGFILLVAAAWGYAQMFGGRAAFIHAGALIGTVMAANVFFVIIPNQRVIVADMIAGRTPAAGLGIRAKQRSTHNNYLTLPVVFTMISSHYPMAYASRWSWAILAGIFIVGGVVRHFYNQDHAGHGRQWVLWWVAGFIMAGVIALAALKPPPPVAAETPSFARVRTIIAERCAACHSARPTFEGFDAPPAGVVFDNAADILRLASRINDQAVATDAMPMANVTAMTGDERAALAAWYQAGAPSQ